MNRSALVLASVMALLVVPAFPYETLGQPTQSLTGAPSGAGVGCYVQYAQFRPPGLFDRGTCEYSCRSVFGTPSQWTGDRTESGANADYLRCANQCDVRDRNEQERSRKQY